MYTTYTSLYASKFRDTDSDRIRIFISIFYILKFSYICVIILFTKIYHDIAMSTNNFFVSLSYDNYSPNFEIVYFNI